MSELTYLYCDFCNAEKTPGKEYRLPDSWAEALELPLGSVSLRGYHVGVYDTAAGWVTVGDDVHRCPVCVQEDKDRKSFKGKKGMAALEMMAAALEKETEK